MQVQAGLRGVEHRIEEIEQNIAELKHELSELRKVKRSAERRLARPAKPKPDPTEVVNKYRENAKRYYLEHRDEVLAKQKAYREKQLNRAHDAEIVQVTD